MKQDLKRNLAKEGLVLMVILIFSSILLVIFPEKAGTVTSTAKDYFFEMLYILPAIMILMGLFSVFVPDKFVSEYLGKTSGIKGMLIAIFLGALPTGPLYVAFPLAAMWLKKGASIANIVVFLSAWACIKIPQEIVEFRFLGVKFMLLRLGLTVIFVMIMGVGIEKIIRSSDRKNGL